MKTSEDIEIHAADWVARQDRSDLAPAQQEALDAWLDESIANRVAYLRLHTAWEKGEKLRALPSRTTRGPYSGARWFASLPHWLPRATAGGCAAALAVVLWVGWKSQQDLHDYATPIGAREVVALADGSKLTLNTSTRLSTVVNAHERTVWLKDGEAFFDVAHDASRPFVILIDQRRIVVTGTKFSVRRDGERLDVTVLEGRVQIHSGETPLRVVSRNEVAVGIGANVLVTPQSEARTRAAVGWLQGRLLFDQITLAEAAAQFNRYNRKKIVIADRAARDIEIGGSFEASNVKTFARLVATGFGLTVRETGDEITVYGSPSR